jgi:hypothetical protein
MWTLEACRPHTILFWWFSFGNHRRPVCIRPCALAASLSGRRRKGGLRSLPILGHMTQGNIELNTDRLFGEEECKMQAYLSDTSGCIFDFNAQCAGGHSSRAFSDICYGAQEPALDGSLAPLTENSGTFSLKCYWTCE